MNESLMTPIVEALGWTLLHAVWQIALIAMLLRIVLWIVPRERAVLRYHAALSALVLIVGWSGFEFTTQYQTFQAQQAHQAATTGERLEIDLAQLAGNFLQTGSDEALELSSLIKPYLPIAVVIWLLGILFMTTRLLGGQWLLYQWRRRRSEAVSDHWQRKLDRYARRIGLKKHIQMLQADWVREPITFGHVKPVILVPVGMLTGMAPEQVEAILWHELAHIRRADFLVNWLQSWVEVLFFFHPLVWWISASVRESREHCCDDLAVRHCRDPWLYAEALTRLPASVQQFKPSLAMSAKGNLDSVKNRIVRLISVDNRPTPILKVVLCSMVLLFGLSVWAVNGNEQTARNIRLKLHPNVTNSQIDVLVEDLRGIGVEMGDIEMQREGQSLKSLSAIFRYQHEDEKRAALLRTKENLTQLELLDLVDGTEIISTSFKIILKNGSSFSVSIDEKWLVRQEKNVVFGNPHPGFELPKELRKNARSSEDKVHYYLNGEKLVHRVVEPTPDVIQNLRPEDILSMDVIKISPENTELFAQNVLAEIRFTLHEGIIFEGGKLYPSGNIKEFVLPLKEEENPPYLVLDGQAVDDIDLEADEIERIDIFKGDKAVALYGEEARNGAVVVVSKKGVKPEIHRHQDEHKDTHIDGSVLPAPPIPINGLILLDGAAVTAKELGEVGDEIEEFYVVKGEEVVAEYGEAAKDGVIFVTTKKGKDKNKDFKNYFKLDKKDHKKATQKLKDKEKDGFKTKVKIRGDKDKEPLYVIDGKIADPKDLEPD
ncbi:MAG: M56 family metallopeptidase, partial [Bacteroidota bacterium]